MGQSVSNDALWEKLSEMDKKLNELATMQKSVAPKQDQAEIKLDFSEVKEGIITSIKGEIRILGLSNDSHFEANRKNIQQLGEDILKIFRVVVRMRKHQKESVEPQTESKERYFNFKLFKVTKTSLVITALALLVFLLTMFCMKQQNDYSLLVDEYYKQKRHLNMTQEEVEIPQDNNTFGKKKEH